MKIYFLTALLFALTEAQPVLKFEGSSSYVCPDRVGNAIAVAVAEQVDVQAEAIGVVPPATSLYTDSLNVRRQLRGNGEDGRELTWCTNNGCPPNNPYQYCTIIGCNRRRELPMTTRAEQESASPLCPDLIASARAEFDAQAAALLQSNLANGIACGTLFSNITISCQE